MEEVTASVSPLKEQLFRDLTADGIRCDGNPARHTRLQNVHAEDAETAETPGLAAGFLRMLAEAPAAAAPVLKSHI